MTDIKRGAHGGHSYTHRAIASLVQAAPVQNTWYTVLDTTEDVRIILATISIAVAVEDLEMRITMDGVVLTGLQGAAVVGTNYKAVFATTTTATGFIFTLATDITSTGLRSFLLEARSVKVEVRKTTALGAGNLSSGIVYASRS